MPSSAPVSARKWVLQPYIVLTPKPSAYRRGLSFYLQESPRESLANGPLYVYNVFKKTGSDGNRDSSV
jgi:hypothetical protein